jgi:ankyrin repeat protein
MSTHLKEIKALTSLAARAGHIEVVRMLVQSGASINHLDESGNAPIHWAARGGYLEVVQYLAENGADLDLESKDSCVALHDAIFNEKPEVVSFLLDREVKVDARSSIALGKIDLVKEFIQKGFNVNRRYEGFDGYPISDAIHFKHVHVIEILIQAGFDVHSILNSSGDSALHFCRALEDINILNIFVSAGADVSLKNNQGSIPLHVASRSTSGSVVNSVKRLIELGSDINSVSKDGNTPLWHAAYCQNTELIEYLLLAGAQVDISDNSGRTPLKASLHRKGGLTSARILIEYGADINTSDNRGLRPIHIATAQGDEELVRLLLAHGADIS